MNAVVPKPWGYEYCAFDNGKAAVWILHIARGRKTSRHCHPNKRTRLIPLQGEIQTDLNGTLLTDIETLGVVDIQKGEMHQTLAVGVHTASENGAFVMEIEEPSDKGDIVRADDVYGRAGAPIESQTVPCNGELLRLSPKAQSLMGYRFELGAPDLKIEFGGEVRGAPDLVLEFGGETLGIYKEKTRRVSDCIAEYVRALGIERVFGVTGGGAMHLNDSFRDIFVAMHHEQAAAMAAEAYARLRGLGCSLVTTGPGGTNAMTGLACAWVDSIPVLFISGQVTRNTLMNGHGLRQFGVQETDIVTLVRSQTKYAVTVKNERAIRYELERAVWTAREGRPGPVWVDIPLDIQSKQVRWEELPSFFPAPAKPPAPSLSIFPNLAAERPVLVIGNGVHLARAEEECRRLVRHWGMPVVSSWSAADIIPTDDPLYIGRFGIFGDRAANFAVQNADLLIVLGSRLSIPQVGHTFKTFARAARIVMVDVDAKEMVKPSLHVEHPIVSDVRDFITEALKRAPPNDVGAWVTRCQSWKARYPVVASENRDGDDINSFRFVDALSDALPDDALVVTDMGTAFTCTFQAARVKLGQRWITASGHAPMGYGLPGAIGAHYATGKKVVCIVGDGGLQFNLQELQTIRHHNLPIVIFVLENGGYLAMKHTQMNHFGRFVGADASSGVSTPKTWRIADAYGLPCWLFWEEEGLASGLRRILQTDAPVVAEVHMPPMQQLIPRSSSMKRPDGSITSKPIEDLYPFLPRDEFRAQMIVPPIEEI